MEAEAILYNAEFAYPDPYQNPNERPRQETSMSILYTSPNWYQAVADAVRFFRDRQQAIPEHFGEVWCLKVGTDRFGPINAKGHIQARHSFPFFEWKIDHGSSLDDAVEVLRGRYTAERE